MSAISNKSIWRTYVEVGEDGHLGHGGDARLAVVLQHGLLHVLERLLDGGDLGLAVHVHVVRLGDAGGVGYAAGSDQRVALYTRWTSTRPGMTGVLEDGGYKLERIKRGISMRAGGSAVTIGSS